MPLSYSDVREKYRPEYVRALFVGESRPAQGVFFYNENSNLYRYTKQAFEQVSSTPFNCEMFKQYGCWLYDVCDDPVNDMAPADRREQIRYGLPHLKKVLQDLSPEFVYVVKKGDFGNIVYPCVLQASFVDGITSCSLPFPSNGQQGRYVRELSSMLKITIFGGNIK